MKVVLLNTETGKEESFEPVDAREILSNPDTIYQVPQSSRDEIGAHQPLTGSGGDVVGGGDEPVVVAQLQGDSDEMQTGLSIDKYARQDVVKAQVGIPQGTGEAAVQSGAVESAEGGQKQDSTTMTATELRAALDQRGVAYNSTAKKSELQALYDQQG